MYSILLALRDFTFDMTVFFLKWKNNYPLKKNNCDSVPNWLDCSLTDTEIKKKQIPTLCFD